MTYLTDTLAVVEVPKSAHNFDIKGECIGFLTSPLNRNVDFLWLPEGNFRILGTITESEIDFDCACLFNILPKEMYSLFASKGIDLTEKKYLVIEKLS